MTSLRYAVVLQPLSTEDGGGYAAVVPDLPGCMSDGETPEQALANIEDAIESWLEAARDLGHSVPEASREAPLLPSRSEAA